MKDTLHHDHPRFMEFYNRLCVECEYPDGCQHDHSGTIEVLNAMGLDIESSLAFIKSNGGRCCDCEVLFNIIPIEWVLNDPTLLDGEPPAST